MVSNIFQTAWKGFRDNLEGLWTVWKVLELSKKFPLSLESFWTIWKVYNQFGKFPDSLERQRYVTSWTKSLKLYLPTKFQKNVMYLSTCRNKDLCTFGVYVAKAICALFAYICRGNDLRSSSGNFLRLFRPLKGSILALCHYQ